MVNLFKWVLSELNLMNAQKMPTIISPQDIEFLEVPPTIRPSLFGPIIKAKKRKFKNEQQQTHFLAPATSLNSSL